MGGVGILLAEKRMMAIFDVKRVPDRIMLTKLVLGRSLKTVLPVYVPKAGLDDNVKYLFYKNPQRALTKISASELLFVYGGSNGYIGKNAIVYEEVHCGRGFGRRNLEGE